MARPEATRLPTSTRRHELTRPDTDGHARHGCVWNRYTRPCKSGAIPPKAEQISTFRCVTVTPAPAVMSCPIDATESQDDTMTPNVTTYDTRDNPLQPHMTLTIRGAPQRTRGCRREGWFSDKFKFFWQLVDLTGLSSLQRPPSGHRHLRHLRGLSLY